MAERLIDLDKVKPMDFPSYEMDGMDVVQYLNTLPTVDAVEVVRCKDCKFADPYERMDGETGYYCMCGKNSFTYGQNFDRQFHPVREANDFCSYGERRTDANL